MIDNIGFGDFKFRLPSGKVLKKASNITQLKKHLKTIPPDSLEYHSSNNHLSNWFASRGKFDLSTKFRKITKDDFDNIEKRRKYHLKLLIESGEKENQTTRIVEFSDTIEDYKTCLLIPIFLSLLPLSPSFNCCFLFQKIFVF